MIVKPTDMKKILICLLCAFGAMVPLLGQNSDADLFSGVVINNKSGNLDYMREGDANKESGIKNDEFALYKMGKSPDILLRLISFKLAQEQGLQLQAPISQYIGSDFTSYNDSITVNMLLNHTSGLRDIDMVNEYQFALKGNESLSSILEGSNGVQVIDSLKESYHFSLLNNLLLIEVLQRATGKSISKLLNEMLIIPLQLNHTIYWVPGETSNTETQAADITASYLSDEPATRSELSAKMLSSQYTARALQLETNEYDKVKTDLYKVEVPEENLLRFFTCANDLQVVLDKLSGNELLNDEYKNLFFKSINCNLNHLKSSSDYSFNYYISYLGLYLRIRYDVSENNYCLMLSNSSESVANQYFTSLVKP